MGAHGCSVVTGSPGGAEGHCRSQGLGHSVLIQTARGEMRRVSLQHCETGFGAAGEEGFSVL